MNVLRRKIWGSLVGVVLLAVGLSACGTTPAPLVEHKSEPPADLSGKVQSLQRQLRDRDKRIEELESQLDTLKLIEQDFTRQRSPVYPPATLTPIR
ncbi:MAG: hypothetical protein ABL970_01945 [Nitrospira sp.]